VDDQGKFDFRNWAEQGLPEMRPWQEALESAFADGISPD
jgi:hypothetical protein